MLLSFFTSPSTQAKSAAHKQSFYNTCKWFHHHPHADMAPTTNWNITILYDGQIRTIPLQSDQSACPSPPSTKSISIALSSSIEYTTTSQPSRLLSLPAEIRHQIYKEVFALNLSPRMSLSILYDKPNLIGSLSHLPLLQKCRQIYAEARLLPFESNRIRVLPMVRK